MAPQATTRHAAERPLQPELIEEDFDLATAMVLDYALQTQAFSLRELRGHLEDKDVRLPETAQAWRVLFIEMQDQIVADSAADETATMEHTWVVEKVGRENRYTLAEMARRQQVPTRLKELGHLDLVVEPIKEVSETSVFAAIEGPISLLSDEQQTVAARQRAARVAIETAERKAAVTLAMLQRVLRTNSNGYMRPRHLVGAVAAANGIDSTAAERIVTEAQQAGIFVTRRRGGNTEYGIPANDETQLDGTVNPPEAAARQERHLTDTEIRLALSIAEDMVEKASRYIKPLETIRSLEQDLAQRDPQLSKEVSARQFRKVLRILQSIGVLKIEDSSQTRTRRTSPKVDIAPGLTKQLWTDEQESYIGKLRAFTLKR